VPAKGEERQRGGGDMLGSLGFSFLRASEGAHYGVPGAGGVAVPGERSLAGNFGFSRLGYDELGEAREDFLQESGGGGGREPGEAEHEEPDIGLDELFGLMTEDLEVVSVTCLFQS
jgi:hypothetical protein